jgi:hypothetical protein
MFGDEIPRIGDWWKVANESIDMNQTILGVIPKRELNFAAKGPSSAHPMLVCYLNTVESGPVVKTVPRTRHPQGRFGWQHSRHAACLTSCALDDKATVCPTVYAVALVDFEPDGVTVFSCTEPPSSHIMRNLRNLGFIEE